MNIFRISSVNTAVLHCVNTVVLHRVNTAVPHCEYSCQSCEYSWTSLCVNTAGVPCGSTDGISDMNAAALTGVNTSV